jgi:type IV pilus assembly protein PilE
MSTSPVCSSNARKRPGFTLIELMVTVAIAGILAAVAYPSYVNYMKKGRRAAAQAHLMEIAQRQQEYLLDARTYASTLATLGVTTPADVAANYTVADPVITAGPPVSFLVSAVPIAGGAQAGDGTLSIDSSGAKLPAGVW